MLLVDVGNTRVKWATYADGVIGVQQAAAHAQWGASDWRDALFGKQPVKQVLAAAVAGEQPRARLRQAAADAGATLTFVAATAHAGGVHNSYPDPALLGVDRWVAVIGAYHLQRKACCVIDVGTATTVDAVDDQGQHLGGFIVPGPQLMVRSLLHGTSDLAAHSARSRPAAQPMFATNTRDAIERGCRLALAALIDRACDELAEQIHSSPALVGTGGALPEVLPYVRAGIAVVPDLVLQGLAVLAVEDT